MPTLSRRAALATPAAVMLAGAPVVAAAHPDAEIFAACAAHREAIEASNRYRGDDSAEEDRLWAAIAAAEERIFACQPRTFAGVRAVAEIAQRLARLPSGEENWSTSFTADFPTFVCQSVLRLTAA